MTRGQRALHARLWFLLALLIAALFAGALIVRERAQGAQDQWRAEDS